MSWMARLERIPITERDALLKKLGSEETIRSIECEIDPEHADYCICSYQEFMESGKA